MEEAKHYIEIIDTTLRDGEQTDNVSFMPKEKLVIARALLQDIKVDCIEVASARVSEGEKEAVGLICLWADEFGYLDRVEVLGFNDDGKSVDWIKQCGCKHLNLLCKGSLSHCKYQLKKTPQEHIKDIKNTVEYAMQNGITTNVYLEDWSGGMINSPEYVYEIIDGLKDMKINRFMLPDTLGILNPSNTFKFMSDMINRYPNLHFDFHSHNDYDLAVANCLAAVQAGCKGLHTTVNGLGERAGNATLSSILAVLKDHVGIETNVDESKLYKTSRLVESYSGVIIPNNKPIIGESVFTQVAGIHADGDKKHALYQNSLIPERFGRKREYALGKNSGKASIQKNLEELGLELTPEQTKLVTDRITELGDKKEIVTPDDLPFIINDIIGHKAGLEKVELVSYMVSTAKGLRSNASLKIKINGVEYETSATGDGQYDAFAKGLKTIYTEKLQREFPILTNYYVTIPPGGKTDALVQTVITWEYNGKTIRTRGLDADQTDSAIKATIKMLNVIES